MAYFLTCVHPFHDHKLGMIERGHAIYDKHEIARLYHLDNREHHFVKSYHTAAEEQWPWPPEHPNKLKLAEPQYEEDDE